MSSWPFMEWDEIRKRHLNGSINATILKSMKNMHKKLNTLLVFVSENV